MNRWVHRIAAPLAFAASAFSAANLPTDRHVWVPDTPTGLESQIVLEPLQVQPPLLVRQRERIRQSYEEERAIVEKIFGGRIKAITHAFTKAGSNEVLLFDQETGEFIGSEMWEGDRTPFRDDAKGTPRRARQLMDQYRGLNRRPALEARVLRTVDRLEREREGEIYYATGRLDHVKYYAETQTGHLWWVFGNIYEWTNNHRDIRGHLEIESTGNIGAASSQNALGIAQFIRTHHATLRTLYKNNNQPYDVLDVFQQVELAGMARQVLAKRVGSALAGAGGYIAGEHWKENSQNGSDIRVRLGAQEQDHSELRDYIAGVEFTPRLLRRHKLEKGRAFGSESGSYFWLSVAGADIANWAEDRFEQTDAFRYRLTENLSLDQIAARTGFSKETVRKLNFQRLAKDSYVYFPQPLENQVQGFTVQDDYHITRPALRDVWEEWNQFTGEWNDAVAHHFANRFLEAGFVAGYFACKTFGIEDPGHARFIREVYTKSAARNRMIDEHVAQLRGALAPIVATLSYATPQSVSPSK